MRALLKAAVAASAAASVVSSAASAEGKFAVYLSMSYVGNGWQNEATNMISAMAKYYSDKVDLHIQVAGPVAQRQIQQINSMVQAGAKAIIVYPISPTALNAAIKNACDKGVVVFAYDSRVTEPCAYNVHPDQYELAVTGADWVSGQMHHKGNVLLVTGVPGTTVDTDRNRGFRDVIGKYPEMKIVGEVNGMWSLAIVEKVITEFMATHKWSDIDGIVGTGGGWTAWQQELAARTENSRPMGPTARTLPAWRCCPWARSPMRRFLMLRSARRRSRSRARRCPARSPSSSRCRCSRARRFRRTP